MAELTFEERIAAVRRFNRFYTKQLNLLNEKYLRSVFSLTEARVIYELERRGKATAAELSAELRLDPGYASRLLRRLGKRGLIDGQPFQRDGRRTVLRLTDKGKEAFGRLDSRARGSIASLLAGLSEGEQARLVGSMGAVEALLGPREKAERRCVLRPFGPGDLGWAVQRHGQAFLQEYDWDQSYEAEVAARVAGFQGLRDPEREQCWIAELDGERAGCVLVSERSDTVAVLELLLVDPPARGQGIGSRLVEQAVGFSRKAGFRKMALQASTVLSAAKHLFRKAGFNPVRKEHCQAFGYYLTMETWELVL